MKQQHITITRFSFKNQKNVSKAFSCENPLFCGLLAHSTSVCKHLVGLGETLLEYFLRLDKQFHGGVSSAWVCSLQNYPPNSSWLQHYCQINENVWMQEWLLHTVMYNIFLRALLILQPSERSILFLFTINVLWVTKCMIGPLIKALRVFLGTLNTNLVFIIYRAWAWLFQ